MLKINPIQLFLRGIDIVNETVGGKIAWLFLPLAAITAFEVVMRYVFNSPTVWAWDVLKQMSGFLIVMGAGYTLLHKKYVMVDVLVVHFSLRTRAIIDLITGLLFLLTFALLTWKSGEFAWRSLLLRETVSSYWAPPIFVLKMFMPIGNCLLLLQGTAKFIRDFTYVTSKIRENIKD
jgi:TRAP-type mannitol/chloroaromatic compound transport system permease small subunit